MTEPQLIHGDCLQVLKTLPESCVQTCVTSPPYWGLRDYGVDGQLGLELTPKEFISKMVEVFAEVRRVLKPDGTLWVNIGDTYSATNYGQGGGWAAGEGKDGSGGNNLTRSLFKNPGYKSGVPPKNLIGIPWKLAFALQDDGWFLRQDIIWHKTNPMPESVKDRCTKSHEYIFLLSKSPKYYFDSEAIREPAKYPNGPGNKTPYNIPGQRDGQNANLGGSLHKIGPKPTRAKRSVWSVSTKPFKEAHFATYPPDLIEPCILAGSRKGDTVLDPFNGAGTTGVVSVKHDRKYIGIELNPDYLELSNQRFKKITKDTK